MEEKSTFWKDVGLGDAEGFNGVGGARSDGRSRSGLRGVLGGIEAEAWGLGDLDGSSTT